MHAAKNRMFLRGALTAVRNHRTGKVSALDDTEAMKCVCPLF